MFVALAVDILEMDLDLDDPDFYFCSVLSFAASLILP